MATNIFEVLGTIVVDTTDFNTKIANAITQVNNLTDALNKLNGTSVNANVNVNQTPSGGSTVGSGGGGGSTGAALSTGTSGTGTSASTGTGGTSSATVGGTSTKTGFKQFVSNATSFLTSPETKALLGGVATAGLNMVAKDFARYYSTGISYHDMTETSFARLTAMLNMSEEDTKKLSDEIQRAALDSSLSLSDAYSMSALMLTYGANPDQVVSDMLMYNSLALGDSSLALRIARAHMQVLGKNTLQAQEGNQFTEAYLPIWDLLSAYYASPEYAALIASGEYEYRSDNRGRTADDLRGNLNDIYSKNPAYVEDEDVTAALRMAYKTGNYAKIMELVQGTHAFQTDRYDESLQLSTSVFATPFADYETSTVLPKKAANALKQMELFEQYEGMLARYAQMWGDLQISGSNAMTSFLEMILMNEENNPGSVPGAFSTMSGALSWFLRSPGQSGLTGLLSKSTSGTFGMASIISRLASIAVRDEFRQDDMKDALERDLFSAYGLFMSEETRAKLRESGGNIDELDIFGKVEHIAGLGLQYLADYMGVGYGDVAAMAMPFADLYHGLLNIPENASTFFEDWANLISIVADPYVSGDEEGATGVHETEDGRYTNGGGRRFGESLSEQPEIRDKNNDDKTKVFLPYFGGGGGFAETTFFEDGSGLPGGASSLMTNLQNLPQQITAAVQQGFSGATVTVNVTTGDVRLNDGALVGTLSPRIDAVLGMLNSRAARG